MQSSENIIRFCNVVLFLYKEMNKQIEFLWLFWFNHYGLTTNKFSMDIVQTLGKRNCFSIRCSGKLAMSMSCPISSHYFTPWNKVNTFEMWKTVLNFQMLTILMLKYPLLGQTNSWMKCLKFTFLSFLKNF